MNLLTSLTGCLGFPCPKLSLKTFLFLILLGGASLFSSGFVQAQTVTNGIYTPEEFEVDEEVTITLSVPQSVGPQNIFVLTFFYSEIKIAPESEIAVGFENCTLCNDYSCETSVSFDNTSQILTVTITLPVGVTATGINDLVRVSGIIVLEEVQPITTPIDIAKSTSSFSMYPNPANKVLHLSMEEMPIGSQIKIVNLLGETVLETSILDSQMTLDIAGLQAGYYVVIATHGGIPSTSRRLIIR